MPSLSSRIAAAKAAARADTAPRCVWCRATDRDAVLTQSIYERIGRVTECENASACHVRFETLNAPVPLSDPLDGRETGRSAAHAPESSTSDLEGN